MIFEAICAIKVANDAIGAVRELCTNLNEVRSVGSSFGKHLTKLSDAKEELVERADRGDSEAFWALEDLRRREEEVKTLMVYGGRANLWTDYQAFMKNRKEMRENQRKRELAQKLAKRKAIKDGLIITAVVLASITAVGAGCLMLYWLVSQKGA